MTENNRPEISIIIVNWNTRELLRRCLESIRANVPPISYEIILADNASSDGSADMVAQSFPEVVLFRNEANLGFSAANNQCLNIARGEWLMLLNPDTELCPGSVQLMIEFMRTHPEAGLVGPKLVQSNGDLQKSGRRFPNFLREVLGITRLFRVVRPWHDKRLSWGREDFDVTAEVDEVAGACMLAKKSAVDQVWFLDERFYMYYEDVDWCYRIKQAGWKVYYIGEATVVHVWAQGAIKRGVWEANNMLYHSQYLYFRKHHGILQSSILRAMSIGLMAVLKCKYSVARIVKPLLGIGK